jgi:glycosyltransferase involved in cell wall biosynthesis
MIGPVPRIYGGISAVVGMLLDSDLPERCRLTYVAEGTREGRFTKVRRFVGAVVRTGWLEVTRQVNLLHLHVGDGGSFYRHALYLALGRLGRVPVLFHWHLPGDASAATRFYVSGGLLRRRLIRWTLSHATRVVVLSPSWEPALAQIAPQARGRIVALPNPVDCAAVFPPADPTERSASQVLFLGDFSQRKGVRDLLAAAPMVKEHYPDVRFVVCGGDAPTDVQALAAPLGASVVFPGFVRGPDKLRHLQQAALLVLPSYAEGVPIAVLEGMAAGLPVVTTPVGGVQDIFADGVNGLLVLPGDPAALAQAISSLLDDADLRLAMGEANRCKALAEFDLPIYVEKLVALYREAACVR